MALDTEEKRYDDIPESVRREFMALVQECIDKKTERREELKRKGIHVHLDGPNYFKDLEDEFKTKYCELKKKYNLD